MLRMSRRSPKILVLAVLASFCFTQHLLYDWTSQSTCPTSILSAPTTGENTTPVISHKLTYSHQVRGVHINASTMYISTPGYQARPRPTYFTDKGELDFRWNLGTYLVAGEVARRYGARYLVDLGCGTAVKLARFKSEFHLVGVDFGKNLAEAKERYPYITLLEANFDSERGCVIDLQPDLLSQAVVVSADVIEHLIDPLKCYTKLLKTFAEYALAIVISTPNRERMASVYRGSFEQNRQGPPVNTAHVREWLEDELEILLLDQGVFPVYSGQLCGRLGACARGFKVEDSSLTNQVHIIGNTQVRSRWLLKPKLTPKVTALVIMDPFTEQTLLDYNINYLTQQGIKVIVIGEKHIHRDATEYLVAISHRQKKDLVRKVVNGANYQVGDWFIVMDAHEVISFPQSTALNLTLKDTLTRIGQEPRGFNAVALSMLFMQDRNGNPHIASVPFKFFNLGAWNKGVGFTDNLHPSVDTLRHRVRIWQKTDFPVHFRLSARTSGPIFEDVFFIGMKVYPFHAQSLRFHPSCRSPYTWLAHGLRGMYVLETALGFMTSDRKKVSTEEYLY